MLYVLLVLPLQSAPAAPPDPALLAPLKVDFEAGPLLPALAAAERQTGLAFAVLPELLPPDPRAPAFSFEGAAKEGLDRLAKALELTWQIGEFGSIVLLPKEPLPKEFWGWKARTFDDDMGVLVTEPSEKGDRLGIRKGDLLVALDGERLRSASEFYKACLAVGPGAESSFTVRRGTELIQLKVKLDDPTVWASQALGLRRYHNAPTPWMVYQKAGHRNPAWDELFRAAAEAADEQGVLWDSERILSAVRACAKAGCRDPQLFDFMINAHQFGEALGREIETWADPAVLQSAYGGSMLFSRAWVDSYFLRQGPPAMRDRARRRVEAAWALLRNFAPWTIPRHLGHSLATLHLLEGRPEASARLMKSMQPKYLREFKEIQGKTHLQALCRLGRFDEALEEAARYEDGPHDSYYRSYVSLVDQTREAHAKRGERPDRFTGHAGLVGWRSLQALGALECAGQGKAILEQRWVDDLEGRYRSHYRVKPEPFFEDVEVRFYTRVLKDYDSRFSASGVVFGAQPLPPKANSTLTQYELFSGAQYNVKPDLGLSRTHAGSSWSQRLPLPSFSNDGSDEIRLFKEGDTVTVRCNGAWVTTDVSPAHRVSGSTLLHSRSISASLDAAIFIPTERPYDNDRIRELLDRVADAKEKLAPEERLKLWDEAASLAPPNSQMRHLRAAIPGKLRDRAPAPAWPEDAASLPELTVEKAVDRLGRRGPLAWTAADPMDADRVWAAGTDGTIYAMSRLRYWTTLHSHVKAFVGRDVRVGRPVFEAKAVWLPTDAGLFRYDRREEVFRRVPIGGIFHGPGLKSARIDGESLIVEIPSGAWSLNTRSEIWSR